MNVALTGASGFIGRAVAQHLQNSGHIVRAVSLRAALPEDALAGSNAVIHLAGEPVAQRWTAAARDKILRSRVEAAFQEDNLDIESLLEEPCVVEEVEIH